MSFALLLTVACDGEQREIQKKEDDAYAAGCEAGRFAGAVAGTDDGTECRERDEVPSEEARDGGLAYCEAQEPTDKELELSCDCQPCGRWEDGYLECYPET